MFMDSLENFIQHLKSSNNQSEWYLQDFIEQNVYSLSTFEAYDASSLVLDMIKDHSMLDLLYELLSILTALQRQSDTTQRPSSLITHPELLNEITKACKETYIIDLIKNLNQSYRL